ncbi:MAG: hypothetical protein V4557_01220 [Bacteroidota bacterium]
MDSQTFVDVIKEVVTEGTVKLIQDVLIKPPGRAPSEDFVAMSQWYNNLKDGDKAMLLSIIRETANSTVFGFFCVLDGVRAIENDNKGVLKLYHEADGRSVLLNNHDEDYLHELM